MLPIFATAHEVTINSQSQAYDMVPAILYLIAVIFALAFVGYLLYHQCAGMISAMTYNERVNVDRYEHFWDEDGLRKYPFSKGSFASNLLHFF